MHNSFYKLEKDIDCLFCTYNLLLCLGTLSEKEYKRKFMSGFIRDYFQNSYKEMVSFFAREEKISADDLKEIIRIIEKQK